ncbi:MULTISPECIES: sensor histidine kinase [unclassified Streptomyces]|uniref:sensor histidine kinase n=1 Tax=unclassified Streptomyces TaxID=2593676 RepID=UPI002E80A24C|nr:sensor histidine kinase [Streptomyces sp. NBC_00589]WTI42579.1 sensor histidine kinase [Streptomyces sp. NBC_00775]WUB33201.1 sensor histidine kinase [Streptomyces sp. NBC_00589]
MTEAPLPDETRPVPLMRMGESPRNIREALRKGIWIVIWLVFLSSPVHDLVSGHHTTTATVAGWLGLTAFVGIYLTLVFRNMGRAFTATPVVAGLVIGLGALAAVLCLTLGPSWLGLFVYVSVACGTSFSLRVAYWTIPLTAVVMLLVGLHGGKEDARNLILLVVLIGYAMTGVRQLVRTTVELRKARATVAQLAANEERLRLARDLHDLLGHSLSLITLKSELAGRMLPDHPDKAAQQVADIEQVSRQALVDVREAVTGYRRPRLAGELAGAQVALTAAGVTADLPAEPDLDGVPEESESALAWALREAITNVVRHSGARRCAVELVRRQTLDGPVLELSVEDDGSGGSGTPGNGLTGLTERLEKAGGSLEAGKVRHGFRLVARVPTGAPAQSSGHPVGSGA